MHRKFPRGKRISHLTDCILPPPFVLVRTILDRTGDDFPDYGNTQNSSEAHADSVSNFKIRSDKTNPHLIFITNKSVRNAFHLQLLLPLHY